MRKIDKTQILATVYKIWLDKLVQANEDHPAYNSSNGKYYYDIIANLIWVQQGLCAYTELRLQDHSLFALEYWENGKYKQCKTKGELDHYNNTIKERFGWNWDNLFVIDADVNKKWKRSNTPNGILKPDLPNFDPTQLLEYDLSNHFFIPNRNLNFATQELVNQDISCLGLNAIADIRRMYLSPLIERVKYQQQTFNEAHNELYQFFTAFEMSKNYMET